MKKMKILSVMIALAFLIGVSAFSEKQDPKKSNSEVWFEYDPVNQNGYLDPDNWIETPSGPVCSSTTSDVCSVFADPDPESGDEGERKPLSSSLSSINSTYGFDDYVSGIIHMRN